MRFPFRYLIFTLIACTEIFLYLLNYSEELHFPGDYEEIKSGSGTIYRIIDVDSLSETYQLGFRNGDHLISLNGQRYELIYIWDTFDNFRPGETIDVVVERNGAEVHLPVKLNSELNEEASFFILYYLLIIAVMLTGLFVLYKKPDDKAARIFFIFTQVFAIGLNSFLFIGNSSYMLIRNALFMFNFPFLGAILIHFFLRFPFDNKIYKSFPKLPLILYLLSLIISLTGAFFHLNFIDGVSADEAAVFKQILEASVLWMSICLLAAMIIAVYNFFTIKGTVASVQYRWVMFAIIFGLLPETLFGFYKDFFDGLEDILPHLSTYVWGTGALVMIIFLSFAILKYKLWDIEVVIKRTLQYSVLSVIIAGSYILLIFLSEYLFDVQSNTARFISIVFSVLLFIPAREIVHKKIDKIFHREPYDPTEAALKFENRLINSYAEENLYEIISRQIDSIFHFSDFKMFIREDENSYRTVFSLDQKAGENYDEKVNLSFNEFDLTNDLFIPPWEMQNNSSLLKKTGFIFPIKKGAEVIGIFACGEKKSQRSFSKQDIELMKLLANRASTIIQLSNLYRIELERREAVQRERERISKDMHDEIGSSLTQIAVLSEIVLSSNNNKVKIEESIKKISGISRNLINNISEIVWAVNPKNDSLDNLAAYLREYAGELMETAGINFTPDFCEDIDTLPLQSEMRRNIFLAVKEILNNIIKHAKAKNVFFSFCRNEKAISILIKDDGCGFNTENIKRGNGLSNITQRIQDCCGTIEIDSEINRGTAYKIELLL